MFFTFGVKYFSLLDRERGKWCSPVRGIKDFKSLKKNSIEWDDPFCGYQSASILRKPNKLMNSGWNRDYPWAQQNGFLLTTVIWLLPLLSVQSASNRDQHYTPDTTPFPGVISLLPGSRLIILDHFQNGRDVLLLLEYTYSGYELAFPAYNASVKTTIRGITECLLHRDGILHSTASHQGVHIIAK